MFCLGARSYLCLASLTDAFSRGAPCSTFLRVAGGLSLSGGRMKAVLEHCVTMQTAGKEPFLYGGNTEQKWGKVVVPVNIC